MGGSLIPAPHTPYNQGIPMLVPHHLTPPPPPPSVIGSHWFLQKNTPFLGSLGKSSWQEKGLKIPPFPKEMRTCMQLLICIRGGGGGRVICILRCQVMALEHCILCQSLSLTLIIGERRFAHFWSKRTVLIHFHRWITDWLVTHLLFFLTYSGLLWCWGLKLRTAYVPLATWLSRRWLVRVVL